MTASPSITIRFTREALLSVATALLAACASQQPKPESAPPAQAKTQPPPHSSKKPWKPLGPYTPGGLYAPGVSDGAPDVPPDIARLPEPVPHAEPLARYGNRSPYAVLGKSYTVLPSAAGYVERGMASWYGTKFDGRVTSSLEPYDLNQFSAAHRTLPLPSYARVTNLESGRSVIVRINDRGPFHDGRLIDLSYAAAIKLGVNVHGTAMVEVRGIDTGQPASEQADSVVAKPAPARAAGMAPRHATTASDVPATKLAPAAVEVASASDDAAIKPATVATQAGASPKDIVAAPPVVKSTGAGTPDAQAVATTSAAASRTPAASPPPPSPPPLPALPSSATTKPPETAGPSSTSAAPAAVLAPTGATSVPAMAPQATPTPAPPVASIPPPHAATNTPVPQIGHPAIDPSTRGFLQLASYGDRGNAERMLQRLQQAGIEHAELVSVQVADQTLWRVHVGPMRADQAEDVAARLESLGFGHPPFFKE
ncbi:MAG TPA: septal ring lytic transglycosylase RlpA family protein [Xanthomonadaceae bacterium]|jgi:rare lipoprotein A